jgi:hypothetical protein
MKLRELFNNEVLDEMSMLIGPVSDSKLYDPVSNHTIYKTYKSKADIIGKLNNNITLYYCTRGGRNAYMAVYSEGKPDDEQIAYLMEYTRDSYPPIGPHAVQKWLWTNPKYRNLIGDLPTKIFFELIDDYHTVTADLEQTPAGRDFWMRKIHQAFGRGLNVYYANFEKNDLIQLRNPADMNRINFTHGVWTSAESSLDKVFVISNKKLTKPKFAPSKHANPLGIKI